MQCERLEKANRRNRDFRRIERALRGKRWILETPDHQWQVAIAD
jgi:hypothetical protein